MKQICKIAQMERSNSINNKFQVPSITPKRAQILLFLIWFAKLSGSTVFGLLVF